MLDAPDGEAYCPRVSFGPTYGMAPLGKQEYRGKVDISISFAPDLRGDGDCMLELWPGAARKPGLRLAIQGMPEPEFCDGLPLLAALWDSGRLDTVQNRDRFCLTVNWKLSIIFDNVLVRPFLYIYYIMYALGAEKIRKVICNHGEGIPAES